MVSLIYNMVDTYFIALTGKQDLVAGVSLAVPVFTLMIAFGDIFGLGGSSIISRLLGEKNETAAKKASAFCIWTSIGFGLLVTLILLLFRAPVLAMPVIIIPGSPLAPQPSSSVLFQVTSCAPREWQPRL